MRRPRQPSGAKCQLASPYTPQLPVDVKHKIDMTARHQFRPDDVGREDPGSAVRGASPSSPAMSYYDSRPRKRRAARHIFQCLVKPC
jgi:hypothetical protein